MASDKEIRAQIDSELVKGLLLINGGGCVALLAFLPFILGEASYLPLSKSVLFSLLIFQLGLVFAIVHNRLRRICSLEYGTEKGSKECNKWPLKYFKFEYDKTCSCRASIIFMWLSILSFLSGGVVVFWGGLKVVCTVAG